MEIINQMEIIILIKKNFYFKINKFRKKLWSKVINFSNNSNSYNNLSNSKIKIFLSNLLKIHLQILKIVINLTSLV